MATKKITLNELRNLVKQSIKENKFNYQHFGQEGEDAYERIMDRYNGPVSEFVVISRAIELAANAGPSKTKLYANALLDALDTLKKNGGYLKSFEEPDPDIY